MFPISYWGGFLHKQSPNCLIIIIIMHPLNNGVSHRSAITWANSPMNRVHRGQHQDAICSFARGFRTGSIANVVSPYCICPPQCITSSVHLQTVCLVGSARSATHGALCYTVPSKAVGWLFREFNQALLCWVGLGRERRSICRASVAH